MFIQSEMTQRKRWTDVLTVPNIHTLLLFFVFYFVFSGPFDTQTS